MDGELTLEGVIAALQKTERCYKCGSIDCTFDSTYGYWECNDCHTCWAYDEDDPDCDELIEVG